MTRGRVARAVDFGDVLLGLLQSGGLRTAASAGGGHRNPPRDIERERVPRTRQASQVLAGTALAPVKNRLHRPPSSRETHSESYVRHFNTP